MTFRAEFNDTTKKLVFATSLGNLSGRDQVNLYSALSDILGITAGMRAEPNATARAQEIISEQFEKHWGKK